MIIVKRWALFLLMAVSIALVAAIGIRGYTIVGSASGYTWQQSKLQAETFVYLAIVSSIVFVLVYGAVLLRSRNLYRELDRLIELTRFGSISIDDTLKKTGKLGEKIRLIYHQLNELNEKRSLKISALSRINDFLLNNIDLSCLLLDANGKITEASRRYLENRDVPRAEVVGKSLETVMEEVSFAEISQKLERERGMVELDTKEPVGFLPIFNRIGELSQAICVLGKQKLYVGAVSDKVERVSRVGRMSGFLKRIGRQRER
jgi:PAS domain-containing protein